MKRPRLSFGDYIDAGINDLIWALNEVPFIKTVGSSCAGHTSITDPHNPDCYPKPQQGHMLLWGEYVSFSFLEDVQVGNERLDNY